MSSYINTKTMQYPLFQGDIRLVTGQHTGEFILSAPFVAVVPTTMPVTTGDTQYVAELPPTLVSGVWVQQWETKERSAAEQLVYERHLLEMRKQQDKHVRSSKRLPTTTL